MAVPPAATRGGLSGSAASQRDLQIHGGISFTWEHDVHLFVKRAKTGEALFGTRAVHRARIADLLNV